MYPTELVKVCGIMTIYALNHAHKHEDEHEQNASFCLHGDSGK